MQKKVDEKMFRAVKTLLSGGATHQECAEYMALGLSTVARISRSEDFNEYRNLSCVAMMEYRKRQKTKTEPKPEPKLELDLKMPGGTLSGAYQINRIVELLKSQNETLTLISNKLAFIVDELTK